MVELTLPLVSTFHGTGRERERRHQRPCPALVQLVGTRSRDPLTTPPPPPEEPEDTLIRMDDYEDDPEVVTAGPPAARCTCISAFANVPEQIMAIGEQRLAGPSFICEVPRSCYPRHSGAVFNP